MHNRTRALIILTLAALAGRAFYRIMELEHQVDLLAAAHRPGYRGYRGEHDRVYTGQLDWQHMSTDEAKQTGRELYDGLQRQRARDTQVVERTAMPSHLTITQGSGAGTRLTLGTEPITIGRFHSASLMIDDDFASGKHARLSREVGGWYVEDLGSANGTYLGRAKVTGRTRVPAGVPIRVGKTVIELRT